MVDDIPEVGGRAPWIAFLILTGIGACIGAFIAIAIVVLIVRAVDDDDHFDQVDQLSPVVAGTAAVEKPHQDCSANSNDCSGLAIVDGSKRPDTVDRLERNALRSGFAKVSAQTPLVRNYERDGLCLSIIDEAPAADGAGDFAGRIMVALDDC